MNCKQVIVMRTDLNMRKGKMCAQAAHACMKDLLMKLVHGVAMDEADKQYYLERFRKICVKAKSEQELDDIFAKAKLAGLKVHMIVDAGDTEFKGVPTKTCLAIGPHSDEMIDPITGMLELL